MEEINGYENEYEFVKVFNKKCVAELDPISKELIDSIFNYKNDKSIITCWRNHYLQKADILIKLENHVKGISIKKGIKNSVHSENIHYFVEFMKENSISSDIIKEYLRFHYGDGTTNGKGKFRLSADEYKQKYPESICKINEAFNNPNFIKKCIKRFITVGTNGIYPISALIFGIPNDYIFITNKEIEKIILGKQDMISSGIHIGSLQVQPKTRCLNYNPLYEKYRQCIQIKWYNLFDNYLEYKYTTLMQKKYK